MAVTTLGAYLILARYNREKWNHLNNSTVAARAVGAEEELIGEQEQAHEQAEELFPEDNFPLPQLTQQERANLPLPTSTETPDFTGVRMLHSFHTNTFAWLYENIPDLNEPGEGDAAPALAEDEPPEKTPSQIIDEMMMASGTGENDPGIGWLAVVDAANFAAFVEKMGGKTGPLWRMYDIDVVPLNNDQTTWDVYKFMTAVHWD
jgi:hypothetical protein